MKKFVFLVLILTLALVAEDENVKTGWSFGGVPAVAYDTDTGFKYGALANIYNYGDGSTYPEYLYSIYAEWSRTTKGSGVNEIFFDSKHLLPKGIRVTADLSYLTEQTLDFYGFNGYEAKFNSDLIDDDSNNPDYISRVYYKHQRELLKITSDFQGHLYKNNLLWVGGFGHFGTDISSVDIDELNEGTDEDDMLPDTTTLFDEYKDNNIIPQDQEDGGNTNFLKLGLVYDSRDNQANPMHGIWTELLFVIAPEFLGSDYGYSQMVFTHRQYFTILPKKLSFAYRLSYQGKLTGEMPFYMLPYIFSSYKTVDGLGGKKSIRGTLRNRIMSDGFAYGNVELRWKFLRTVVFGQNLYLAVNPFFDFGKTIDKYEVDYTTYNANHPNNQVTEQDDELHIGYGMGLKIALNENFIISVDYGMAKDPRDGSSGLYIGLDYLF